MGKTRSSILIKTFPLFLNFIMPSFDKLSKSKSLLSQRIFLPIANTASQTKNIPVIFLILVFIYKKYGKAWALIFRKTLPE